MTLVGNEWREKNIKNLKNCKCAYVHTDTGAYTHGHTSMVSTNGELQLSMGTEGQKGSGRGPVCFRPCSQHRVGGEGAWGS